MPQTYDEIILPLTFIQRIAQMRYGQLNDPNSVHTKELEQLVDMDIKVIAQMAHEKSKPDPKEQLSLPL